MDSTNKKIRIMAFMLIFSIALMGIKFLAYSLTGSNAILTDALESIINVTAGTFALFSIFISSQPKDANHPYGHGKVEFLSAGLEGGMILIAGMAMIAKAAYDLYHPRALAALDVGAILSAAAGLCNFFMGTFLVKRGKKNQSPIMLADGKHLISDTISSVGLVAGLILIHITGALWLDNVLAIVFGAYIVHMGFKIFRESLTGLLDEADYKKLAQLVNILDKNRHPMWIDMHNLRAIKFGPHLHVDGHITLPWYLTLEEAHHAITSVEDLVKNNSEGEVELFIHPDPCRPISCPICPVANCPHRKEGHVKTLEWTLANLLPDQRHTL